LCIATRILLFGSRLQRLSTFCSPSHSTRHVFKRRLRSRDNSVLEDGVLCQDVSNEPDRTWVVADRQIRITGGDSVLLLVVGVTPTIPKAYSKDAEPTPGGRTKAMVVIICPILTRVKYGLKATHASNRS